MMRAVVSVPPPGSKPTTMVTGLLGKFCAAAAAANAMPAAIPSQRLIVPPPGGLPAFEDRLALLHERPAPLGVVLAVEAFLHPSLAGGRVVAGLRHLADHALR